MNIHGARRAGRRRRKSCVGCSWSAACGVQGRGHIARLPAQLVTDNVTDDANKQREIRSLFVRTNILIRRFYNARWMSNVFCLKPIVYVYMLLL